MGDLGELTKHFEARTVRRFGEVVKGYTYFADGDVLCAKITPCFENGKLGIAQDLENGVGFGSSEFVVMRSKGEILPEFLYYYLSREAFREAGQAVMSGAVGHKRVPKEHFENLEIPLPPLDEQKRIVAVLDQAFAALDRARSITEQNISDTEELRIRTAKQLVTTMMQGVSREKLGDLAEFRNGLNFSRHSQGETVKIAGVGDFQNNFLLPVQQLKTTMIEGSLRNDDKLREGDIISVRSNGNKALIGRVMLVGETEPDVSFSGFVIRIRRTSEKLSSEFLCRFMKSADAVSHLIAGGGGAQISNLNQRILSQLEVPLPSPETQDNFANAMARLDDSCRELTTRYKNKLAQLSVIRESLLYSALAGQLT